jgi:conjugative relaxase-like TrwC/TraI family protein
MLVMSRGALSAAQAERYYTEKYSVDDYYSEEQRVAGEWFGRGAAALGLSGTVAPEDFRAVLEGRDPHTGQTLVRDSARGQGRRAGWDATFNAPKSVSLQALAGGDGRLVAAHRQAVSRALTELEGFALSRRRGGREWVLTENVVAARFEHIAARPAQGGDDSPAPDPHLHTHVVIANLTRRPDRAWRALDPLEIYRSQGFATAVYRAELALAVGRLGYRIRVTAADGRWELEGYTRSQLQAFSRRRQEIEQELSRLGLKGAAAAQNLAHQTRAPKQRWSSDQLAARWRERAARHGIRPEVLLCEARGREIPPLDPDRAREALRFSTAHHTEREAVVDRRAVEATALRFAMGHTDLDRLRRAVAEAQERGELLAASAEITSPQGAYTTADMIALERDNLRRARAGIGRAEPLAPLASLAGWVPNRPLGADQLATARATLLARDWITCIEGHAGTAKTTTVGAIGEFAQAQGYRVRGFAPTTRAVQALAAAGLEARTVASLLASAEAEREARALWLVDESSLLGTRQLNELLRRADTAGVARVVLVGDQRQHHAIEAGRPVHQLQRAGIQVARLETIRRQRPAPLRAVVKLAAAGRIERALALLEEQNRIREVPEPGARHQAIAREYLAAHAAGELALVVSPANPERMQLNRMIHQELTAHGKVAARAHQQSILVNRDLTRAQRKHANSYQVDDVVRFTRGSARLGLRGGSYARVATVDRERDRIGVRTERGDLVDYTPARLVGVQVFHEAQRAFAAGDRIQFRAPNRELRVANGELATITAIDDSRVELRLVRGGHLRGGRELLRHTDYGYASTSHSSVGATVERVIVNIDTLGAAELVNRKQFYVSISRSRSELTLYTDSRARLPGAVARSREKAIALDRVLQRPGPRIIPDPARAPHPAHAHGRSWGHR